MKRMFILSIVAALLGGCVIVPAGYGDHRDSYYRERGYNPRDGNYRYGDYNRYDGGYHTDHGQ